MFMRLPSEGPVNKPRRLFGASLIALGIVLGFDMFLEMIGTVYVALHFLTSKVTANDVHVPILVTQMIAEIIFCVLAVMLVHFGWRVWKSA
jgi:hypothetical protein